MHIFFGENSIEMAVYVLQGHHLAGASEKVQTCGAEWGPSPLAGNLNSCSIGYNL